MIVNAREGFVVDSKCYNNKCKGIRALDIVKKHQCELILEGRRK
jgi:hypothetical protein